jgi:L-cysteate sulfo-lyase
MNGIKARKLDFAHLPTPLERLDRLTAHLAGPTIWMKRDDCTGLSFGGNKARKLEYILQRAIESGADSIITCGALQSNHARQTAALSAKLGLSCHVLLRENALVSDPQYRQGGNLLLDRLHGAHIHYLPADANLADEAVVLSRALTAAGNKPFVIPGGGSDLSGTLGYVNAAAEIDRQAKNIGLHIKEIVLAVGSGGTHAGIVAGLHLLGSSASALGISVGPRRAEIEPIVFSLATEAAKHVDTACRVERSHVRVNDSYLGEGYGVAGSAVAEAVLLLARLEGIVLDPVYTGKAMAGLIDLVKQGVYTREDSVVFIHTGGGPAIFAYEQQIGGWAAAFDAGGSSASRGVEVAAMDRGVS